MLENKLIGGRFEIGPILGQGGMGAVYKGIDRTTGESVAIKSLRPEIVNSEPEILRRFDREGEILRKLNHPNIVKMLATVEDQNQHFLITEYVAGGSLRDMLDRERQLPVQRAIEIILDLCDALIRAHRLKVIHRDIKPANILMALDGTPLLSDFGVAHSSDAPHMTETGSIVGTLQYLSPEACQGEHQDHRSDIWSLGITLYEMLAGERPFTGDNPAVMLNNILNMPTPDIRRLRPDVPFALTHLMMRMLEKKRDNRIGSIRFVSAQLEAILSGDNIPPEDTPTPYRFELPIDNIPNSNLYAHLDEPTVTPISSKGLTAQQLVGIQLQETTPSNRGFSFTRKRVLLGLTICLVIILGGIAGILLTQPALTGPTFDCQLKANEHLVLVADLEPIGTTSREVSRFIIEDLHDELTVSVPFSTIRVCAYPHIIHSSAEAFQIAERFGASVMVWGNYNPDFIELAIEMGVTDGFPNINIARDRIEVLGNVHLTF